LAATGPDIVVTTSANVTLLQTSIVSLLCTGPETLSPLNEMSVQVGGPGRMP
jgi:hypothetical protein